MSLWRRSRADDASPSRLGSGRSALDFSDNPYAAAAVGLSFVAGCALLRWALLGQSETRLPFVTLYPAVALAALLGGFWPGVIATVCSALLASHFAAAPAAAAKDPIDLPSLAIFVAGALIVSWTAELSKRARRAADRAQASQRAEFESSGLERTAELAQAKQALQTEIGERRSLEDRFRQVVDTASTAMIMIDARGVIELVNVEAERVFGHRRQDLVGQTIDMLLPERLRDAHSAHRGDYFVAPAQRALGKRHDLHALRANGDEFPVEIALSPLQAPDGVGVICEIVDISKRKDGEQASRESEEQMRLTFDSIKDYAVVMLDLEGRIVSWNAGAERQTGYAKPQILGRSFSLFHLPEDVEAGKPERQLRVAASEERFEDEGWRLRSDGSRYLANVVITAIRGSMGEIRGFVDVTRDITDRKRIETELIEANERFVLAAEAAGLGFYDLDVETRTSRWDAQMFRLYGVAPESPETPYAIWKRSVHPEDRAAAEQRMNDATTQFAPQDYEFRIVQPDGAIRHMRGAATVKRDPATGHTRMFGLNFDITSRKRIETELRESNDRFVVAAEAAGLGFWEYDIAARTVRWDERMFAIRGSASVEGNHYGIRYSFVHADDRARVDRELEEAAAGRKKFNCEYRIVRQDGAVRHMKSAANLQGDLAVGKASLLGVSFDITERQEIEDQLIQTNLRFALAAEAAELGFWEYDIAAGLLHWDDQTFKLYDADRRDGPQPYQLWSNGLHPDDRAKAEEEVRQTAANERKFDTEFRVVWRDGSIRHLRAFAKLTRDSQTGAPRMFGVNFDITERKRIENEVLDANERFVLAAEAAGLGFWDYEIATQVSRWDAQMYSLHGAARGAVLDAAARMDRLHPDDRARVAKALRDAEAGLRSFEAEYRIVLPDGSVRHFRSAASLKRDAVGRAARLLGVSFDITERNETLEALEQARDAAEAANRAKSEFLAVMSHEIRTPMNGIMGMNALLHETKLSKRQKRMTETIRDSAESLLTIIDDVLDLSKLESGRIELEDVDFDLLHLIDRTVDLFAPRAAQKGLSLTTDRTAVSRAALRGDDARLRQIMLNLVANAIKFTASGSVTIIAATTDVDALQTQVRCEVRDTGSGVSEGAKKRIFKPFEQADSSISRRFGGTGLGLSICKRLIGLMGGEIGVSDREGGGSVFWFELVLSRAALDIAAQAQIGETVARAKPTRTGRILLAEDNAINIDVATMILESAGYVVDVAVDGNEAIAAVRQRRYGLVLMDVQMPILDGLTATREIRATERAGDHLPIIAMTANAMKEDQRRCLDAGMDDYFSKPFQPARLIEKVAHWMEQFGAREAAHAEAPAAAIDAVPVLDALAVEQLQACFPRNRFDVLLGRFLDELEKHKETLPRLAQTPSLPELGQAAHKLIGSAGHFGARQVQQLATDLEAACGAGDDKSVSTLIAQFAPASDAASAALREKYPATTLH